MAQILNGRELARRVRVKVAEMVESLPSRPGMAALLVGDDPASHVYVGLKEKTCQEVGIHFEKTMFPADVPQAELIKKIHELNRRDDIHGILVQLPLPNQNADEVIYEVDPRKDVDGFHPQNLQRLDDGKPGLVPPVALGIMKLIDASGKNISHQTAAIISSEIFARPLVALLKEQNVTTSVIHPDSPDLSAATREADILIVAIGRPRFVKGDLVKHGAIVIDVGTTKTAAGLIGDVERESVEPVAGFLTPVPGGVGPTTVAMLALNVVKAYRSQKQPLPE